MGLFSFLFGIGSGISEYTKKKEKELDNQDNFEKDLINKGIYNSENFEEEDLEEDDYYYEDDK